MFPTTSPGKSSAPVPSRHSRGDGEPLAGRRHSNGGVTPQRDNGISPRQAASGLVVPKTAKGMHSPSSSAEKDTTESGGGGGRSLDGSGGATARTLLDDNDVNDELDVGSGAADFADVDNDAARSSGGGNPQKSAPTGGVVEQSSDGGGEVSGVDLSAKNERENEEMDRWPGQHSPSQPISTNSGNSSHRRGRGCVEASDAHLGEAFAAGKGIFDPQHNDDDFSHTSSTELTLGRPDPASVHWKFSRRLLQT